MSFRESLRQNVSALLRNPGNKICLLKSSAAFFNSLEGRYKFKLASLFYQSQCCFDVNIIN